MRAGGDAGDVHEGAVFRTAVAEDVVAGVERKRSAALEKARAEAFTAAIAEPVAGDEVGEGVESAERVVAEARRPETVMALRPSLYGIGTGHYHLFALGGLVRYWRVLASGVCGLNPLAVHAAADRHGVAGFDGEDAVGRPYQWNNFSKEEIDSHDNDKARNVLRRQTHTDDIHPRNFTEVCIDHKMQGVGGYDSWGALIDKQFTLMPDREYSWNFRIIPLRQKDNNTKQIP